jgi:NADH:ubiquinone oxidoreductase subunit 5 (subunit L)/multisubunit Na+/H+ antiporter MnhA subunit
MELVVIPLFPFILAFLTPVLTGLLNRRVIGVSSAILLAGMCLWVTALALSPTVQAGGALTYNVSWVPAFSLSLNVYWDSLSLLFGILVTGIGSMIALYASFYFETPRELGRFYQLLFLFMGGMIGLLSAGNLLTLFIGWELTSITSFFLISFNGRDDPRARTGALRALMVTGCGGLALLAGLSLLGSAAGSLELSSILTAKSALTDHGLYTAATVLILAGCFSKSAQFPLHFWLPGAMTAPTPASAYLHSATMVKAGIYLLLRLAPVLGDTPLWDTALMGFGLLTLALGSVVALRQRDLKGALAYSTVAQLGALVALIGLPHGGGWVAALVGVVAHALYKGALFLVAGAVDHATHTRDLDQLGGLRRELPGLAGVAVLAGSSMAGLPPFLGFVAKEALLEAFLHDPNPLILLGVGIITVSAACTVTMALILVIDVFFVPPKAHLHPRATPGLTLSPAILAGASLLTGLLVGVLIQPLVTPYLHGESLKLWHGVNAPLLISLTAITGGVGLFALRDRWLKIMLPSLPTGSAVYQGMIQAIEWAAEQVLRTQGGKLRYYLIAILFSMILLNLPAGGANLNILTFLSGIRLEGSADILKIVLLSLSLAATLGSILFKRHLIAALSLGVAGYSVGGLFLLEPAPDVALVQFLVETMGTVLIIIMLGKISEGERKQAIESLWSGSRGGLFRDIAISTVIGLGVTVFCLSAVTNRPSRESIATWHIANSQPLVGANDIVAAIVTDFRGMDTVIEITVFGLAGLGVLTLLSTPEPGRTVQFQAGRILQRLRARGVLQNRLTAEMREEAPDPALQREMQALISRQSISKVGSPLTRTAAVIVVPVAFLIAVSHLLYGGSRPGDGFTAGVVTGLGVALWYVTFGYYEAKRRLRWLHPAALVGAGVGLAVLNAALPLIFGVEFLAHTEVKGLWLPADLHISSTLLFETGIFLAVLGGTSVMMETIAYPQEVETL